MVKIGEGLADEVISEQRHEKGEEITWLSDESSFEAEEKSNT